MPRVSIVMPVYNGIRYIVESIESIKKQSFQDWEMIIVNEFGSDDGCREVVEGYAETDSRFRIVQNSDRLGLAESLNVGIRAAVGEFIARVDVDDPSYPERLEKQVQYMDEHPDVALCGTLQRSVLPNGSNVELVKTDRAELLVSMLFGCEISHCSVMFRRALFAENNWWYDKESLCEDYDLWTKIMFQAPIVNLDEVLVDHRWGFDNISIEKGESLREATREVSKRTLKTLGIDIEREDIDIHVLSGWRSKPMEYVNKNRLRFLKGGYKLLTLILNNKQLQDIVGAEVLQNIMLQRWNWLCDCCNISYNSEMNIVPQKLSKGEPLVSVVLPVYNSASYLRLAIESILEQTYSNWELLVVNEKGSDDGSQEICKFYELLDDRIHFIQNEEKLGLAESLNEGMRMAKGKYIARLDADDLAHSDRFEKQVKYLETHQDVGICGSWQHHFGTEDWIHKPLEKPEQCRASLLFWCDLCHSTLMLRRNVIDKYNLYFDNTYLAEDFELWTRALRVTKIANIQEVLGEYRHGENNITNSKLKELRLESGKIVCEQLKNNLGITVPEEDYILFSGWGNVYFEVLEAEKEQMLQRLKSYIYAVWETNNKVGFYDKDALLTALNSRWKISAQNENWRLWENPYSIERVFDKEVKLQTLRRFRRFFRENQGLRNKLKKVINKIVQPISSAVYVRINKLIDNITHIVANITWQRTDYVLKKLDARIWKAEKVSWDNQNFIISQNFENRKQILDKEEKIRILFVFQVASFWPSVDSFYRSVLNDEHFDVVVLCLDEDVDPTIKTSTAREYLINNTIEFIPYEDFEIDDFMPHIVVLQTPYDTNRSAKYKTQFLKNKGYRTVYIPYGIEIAATEHANEAHFETTVVKNCWRLYTLSDIMYGEYKKHCTNSSAVRVLGLPKFDALFNRNYFPLDDTIKSRANGRKIVLWKVHFPKVISVAGKKVVVTPYISEYISFAQKLKNYSDLFFIFMPHPRFKEFNDDINVKKQLEELLSIIEQTDNVYIDDNDDYRNSLVNADFIMVDRSAVMVEAGSLGVPVLYINNPDFNEPLTAAIEPLINSYYHGTSCNDMESFLTMCLNGEDPLRQIRSKAFAECIPYFDGKCGERIKNDIVDSLNKELQESHEYRLSVENARLKNEILFMTEQFNKFVQIEEQLWQKNDEKIETLMKCLDARIWKSDLRNRDLSDETHRHIDFTYRDIMVALQQQQPFLPANDVKLETDYPIAYESLDHLYPHGTIRDNTRYPRFVKKCEELLMPKKDLAFLDLGCSGGGMVLEAALRGHLSMGLEGSDYSKKEQRAEWRLLGDCLQTCDITKPFYLRRPNGEIQQFDIITAWEVLEHIAETDLYQLFENIKNHLTKEGYFVGSIANWDDIDPVSGVNWHVTVHPYEWWVKKFEDFGFIICSELFVPIDLARGAYNQPQCYLKPADKISSFHIVVKNKG